MGYGAEYAQPSFGGVGRKQYNSDGLLAAEILVEAKKTLEERKPIPFRERLMMVMIIIAQ